MILIISSWARNRLITIPHWR